MKQINEYKNKNFELRENCILEKLTNFIFKSNKSLNRNLQKQQVSNKVFFITLIFVCLSPCLVDAYAGNDAVYTIPSQHKSKQIVLMYNFPDDHDWGQKRAAYFKSPYQDYLSYKDPLDYDETENNAISLQSDSLNDEEISPYPQGSLEEENDSSEYLSNNGGETVLKRAPSYNSWRKGKRVPSYNSWRKGKRAPSYNSWRKGKRVPSYSSWKNGKRGPAYSSWKSGKRVPSYNSWRKGKRSTNDASKRASYNAWRKGKRAPSYNSWRKGKRGPSYNSWRKGKRTPVPDNLLAKLGFEPTLTYSNSILPMSYYQTLVNGGYNDNLFGDQNEPFAPSISEAPTAPDDDRREKRDTTNIIEMDEEDNENDAKSVPILFPL